MPSSSSPSSDNLIPVKNLTPVIRGPGKDKSKSSKSSDYLAKLSWDYDVVLLNPEKFRGKFDCILCEKVLRYPVRFKECGHNCCSACFKQLIGSEPRCPKDQIRFDKDEVIENKNFQLELDMVEVKCSNHANRCPWTGAYKDLQGHMALCAFKLCACPKKCGAKFEKYFLQRHLRDDCKYRDVTCQFCKMKFPFKEKSSHKKTCSKFAVPCPKGCKTTVIKTEMEKHLENDCLNQQMLCPYAEAGCKFQSLRLNIDEHMRSRLDEHISMVTKAIRNALSAMKEEKETEEERLELTNTRLNKVQSRIGGLIKQYESNLIWKIDGFYEKFIEAKSAAGDGYSVCIHSPYIAVSRYGYRLKMTAYLYGYGAVEGLYMSLYVCICSTDQDRLLEWPLRRIIELTVLDQCPEVEERRDISCSIDTSQEEEALTRRPADSKNNPYFGTERFIKLDRLRRKGHYTIGDSIFIRIKFLPLA